MIWRKCVNDSTPYKNSNLIPNKEPSGNVAYNIRKKPLYTPTRAHFFSAHIVPKASKKTSPCPSWGRHDGSACKAARSGKVHQRATSSWREDEEDEKSCCVSIYLNWTILYPSLPVIPCEARSLDPQTPHEARPLKGPNSHLLRSYLEDFGRLGVYRKICIPVVPHKAVAEVSRIGNV